MNIKFDKESLLEAALNGNDEKQFDLGQLYWKENNYMKAERWLRYAANQGHAKAKRDLASGIIKREFLSTRQRLNAAAIHILETLVTAQPSEKQILHLESILQGYLKKQFNLNRTNDE